MDPSSSSSGFGKRPLDVFSDLEMEVCGGLLQLRQQGLLESLPFGWGAKRAHTLKLPVSNYDDKEGELKNEEETGTTAKVTEEKRPVIKIRFKPLPSKPQKIATPPLTGSPTSPLFHGSISAEPSESNSSMAPKLQLKVETKAELHSSRSSRGLKKKKIAQLKQRHNEQSMLKEELEKELKIWIGRHELLMEANKSLKEQLVLKSEGKEKDKFFLHSSDSSQQTMLSHSRVNHSSSRCYTIPDLNIPLEESSDNSSGGFDNKLIDTDKIVAAARARKYRVEYLRHRQTQSGNVQSNRQW